MEVESKVIWKLFDQIEYGMTAILVKHFKCDNDKVLSTSSMLMFYRIHVIRCLKNTKVFNFLDKQGFVFSLCPGDKQ